MKKIDYALSPSTQNGGTTLMQIIEGTAYQLGDYEILIWHYDFPCEDRWRAYYKGEALNYYYLGGAYNHWWHDKWKWGKSAYGRTRKELYKKLEEEKEDLIALIEESEALGKFKEYDWAIKNLDKVNFRDLRPKNS